MTSSELGGTAQPGRLSGAAAGPAAGAAAGQPDPILACRGSRTATWASRALRSLAMLFLVAGHAAIHAAPPTYSGEAPVTSQSEAERAEALKTALAEVVIRISGDPGILASSNVAAAVAQADKYVLQYSYRRGALAADPALAESASQQLVLVAEFDRNAVDRMLANLGLGSGSTAEAVDTTPTEHRIWISGIHSAADYARGLGYLSGQSLVRQSLPLEARGDGLLVRVGLSGGLQRWLDMVGQEGVLRVNSSSPPLEGIDATLVLNP